MIQQECSAKINFSFPHQVQKSNNVWEEWGNASSSQHTYNLTSSECPVLKIDRSINRPLACRLQAPCAMHNRTSHTHVLSRTLWMIGKVYPTQNTFPVAFTCTYSNTTNYKIRQCVFWSDPHTTSNAFCIYWRYSTQYIIKDDTL